MRSYYPVIYIRGYAMTDDEVEGTFNRPYYGFNLGATQFRQTASTEPAMHIFESPVVRLLKDHGYVDAYGRYADDAGSPIPRSVPRDNAASEGTWRKTLWIYRYYDPESAMHGEERPVFPDYAARLFAYLSRVREACGNSDDFKVNLVAHSMGGLIARCYLQSSGTKPFMQAVDALKKYEPAKLFARKVKVNKLFTYATPHRGIAFRRILGPVNWIRDVTGSFRKDQFTPRYMAQYLGPGATRKQPNGYKPRPHAPPLEKTFSLVGTNADDYTVRSARVSVGPKSDGLVLTENAYIHAGPRAYVHRSHSGPFGIVNSEGGYQNLQRFLFGNRFFQIRLRFGSVSGQLPDIDPKTVLQFLLLDIAVAIRGVGGYIDQRSERDMTAEPIEMRKRGRQSYKPKGEQDPVLFSGYLFADAGEEELNINYRFQDNDPYSRWLLDLQIKPKYERIQSALFGLSTSRSNFEGDHFLDDRVEFALADSGTGVSPFMYRWHSEPDNELRTPEQEDGSDERSRYVVPLPIAAQRYFRDVHLLIVVGEWS